MVYQDMSKIENIDEKLLYLMHKLFKMSPEDDEKFLSTIADFSYDEKIDLAYDLWKQVQKEESILKRFYNKVKKIYIQIKEKQYNKQENIEDILAQI